MTNGICFFNFSNVKSCLLQIKVLNSKDFCNFKTDRIDHTMRFDVLQEEYDRKGYTKVKYFISSYRFEEHLRYALRCLRKIRNDYIGETLCIFSSQKSNNSKSLYENTTMSQNDLKNFLGKNLYSICNFMITNSEEQSHIYTISSARDKSSFHDAKKRNESIPNLEKVKRNRFTKMENVIQRFLPFNIPVKIENIEKSDTASPINGIYGIKHEKVKIIVFFCRINVFDVVVCNKLEIFISESDDHLSVSIQNIIGSHTKNIEKSHFCCDLLQSNNENFDFNVPLNCLFDNLRNVCMIKQTRKKLRIDENILKFEIDKSEDCYCFQYITSNLNGDMCRKIISKISKACGNSLY